MPTFQKKKVGMDFISDSFTSLGEQRVEEGKEKKISANSASSVLPVGVKFSMGEMTVITETGFETRDYLSGAG